MQEAKKSIGGPKKEKVCLHPMRITASRCGRLPSLGRVVRCGTRHGELEPPRWISFFLRSLCSEPRRARSRQLFFFLFFFFIFLLFFSPSLLSLPFPSLVHATGRAVRGLALYAKPAKWAAAAAWGGGGNRSRRGHERRLMDLEPAKVLASQWMHRRAEVMRRANRRVATSRGRSELLNAAS